MLLVLLLAPLLTGFVRKIKARLLRRKGASVFQPIAICLRLLRKEWCWPTTPRGCSASRLCDLCRDLGCRRAGADFRDRPLVHWTADLIAIVALLGSARFFLRSPDGRRYQFRGIGSAAKS